MEDIVIRSSKKGGKGIFAQRDFQKGETVLNWKPKPLTYSEMKKLPKEKKNYVLFTGKEYLLMQSPEKYVNHSCESNTIVQGLKDVAIRDISKGEEITSDYGENSMVRFDCKCGSPNCRGKIK